MKDTDFQKLIEMVYMGGGWLPHNDNAKEISEQSAKGTIHTFIECSERDLRFHRCYMALLSFIYDYLPPQFKKAVLKQDFYQWLKHLQGKYKVKYEYADGTKWVVYESISFGNMSQTRFKEYIKEQMPFIFTEVIGAFFEGEIYDNIISTIESEFEKFFYKLEK